MKNGKITHFSHFLAGVCICHWFKNMCTRCVYVCVCMCAVTHNTDEISIWRPMAQPSTQNKKNPSAAAAANWFHGIWHSCCVCVYVLMSRIMICRIYWFSLRVEQHIIRWKFIHCVCVSLFSDAISRNDLAMRVQSIGVLINYCLNNSSFYFWTEKVNRMCAHHHHK